MSEFDELSQSILALQKRGRELERSDAQVTNRELLTRDINALVGSVEEPLAHARALTEAQIIPDDAVLDRFPSSADLEAAIRTTPLEVAAVGKAVEEIKKGFRASRSGILRSVGDAWEEVISRSRLAIPKDLAMITGLDAQRGKALESLSRELTKLSEELPRTIEECLRPDAIASNAGDLTAALEDVPNSVRDFLRRSHGGVRLSEVGVDVLQWLVERGLAGNFEIRPTLD